MPRSPRAARRPSRLFGRGPPGRPGRRVRRCHSSDGLAVGGCGGRVCAGRSRVSQAPLRYPFAEPETRLRLGHPDRGLETAVRGHQSIEWVCRSNSGCPRAQCPCARCLPIGVGRHGPTVRGRSGYLQSMAPDRRPRGISLSLAGDQVRPGGSFISGRFGPAIRRLYLANPKGRTLGSTSTSAKLVSVVRETSSVDQRVPRIGEKQGSPARGELVRDATPQEAEDFLHDPSRQPQVECCSESMLYLCPVWLDSTRPRRHMRVSARHLDGVRHH